MAHANNFIDYFEVLQVHFLAEDLMVKNAYRKLCQIYHPDSNKNASIDKIQLINEAYSVLSNPDKKQKYIEQWISHYSDHTILNGKQLNISMYDFSIQPIKKMISQYMTYIKNKNFESAYNMISKENKNTLFKKDFLIWKHLVAEIYELIDFDCTFSKFGTVNTHSYKDSHNKTIIEFKIKIIERNIFLDRVEEDFFTRKLIYEDGLWSIYLDNLDLKAIIKKYRRLVRINKKNTLLNQKYLKDIGIDSKTGFLSKGKFLEQCELENHRYQRYQNAFSLVAFKFNIQDFETLSKRSVIQFLGAIFKNNSRKLDIFCYFKSGIFVMLLPETNYDSTDIYVQKLLSIIELKKQNDPLKNNLAIEYRIIEQNIIHSLDEHLSVKQLLRQVL